MRKSIYLNKSISLHYDVVEKAEAGIVLFGWEVKSLKAGSANFKNAYVYYDQDHGEMLLQSAVVHPWKTAPETGRQEESRSRRLLLHKSQIVTMGSLAKRPGYTLVPSEVYVDDKGLIKVSLLVVKGKKKFQTKQKIKERDLNRQMQQEVKGQRNSWYN